MSGLSCPPLALERLCLVERVDKEMDCRCARAEADMAVVVAVVEVVGFASPVDNGFSAAPSCASPALIVNEDSHKGAGGTVDAVTRDEGE